MGALKLRKNLERLNAYLFTGRRNFFLTQNSTHNKQVGNCSTNKKTRFITGFYFYQSLNLFGHSVCQQNHFVLQYFNYATCDSNLTGCIF